MWPRGAGGGIRVTREDTSNDIIVLLDVEHTWVQMNAGFIHSLPCCIVNANPRARAQTNATSLHLSVVVEENPRARFRPIVIAGIGNPIIDFKRDTWLIVEFQAKAKNDQHSTRTTTTVTMSTMPLMPIMTTMMSIPTNWSVDPRHCSGYCYGSQL